MRAAIAVFAFMFWIGESSVHAQEYKEGPYIGISAGYLAIEANDGDVSGTDVDVEFDDGFGVGVQLGYKHWVWRLEAEFEYGRSGYQSIDALGSSTDVDGDFDIYRWTGGVYYDLDNLSRFTPYFGGGLGVAYVDVDDVSDGVVTVDGESDTYFTTHGEVGLTIGLSDRFAVVPAYRYLWMNTGGGGLDDDTAHLLKVGARYNF